MESSIKANKPIYRMSGIGHCPRALSAQRLGYPTEPAPVWLERAAAEGNKHEQWMKEQLRSEGYEVEECNECPICIERGLGHREGIHVELEYPNFNLIGHMDARLRKNGSKKGCELKSRSQYEFDRWMKSGFAGFPDNEGQITCYMEADKNDEWFYWSKNRSNGYIDKRILTELPIPMQAIVDKINHVEECVALGTLVEANYDPDSIECRRCGYKSLCVPVAVEFNTVSESRLLEACEKWRTGTAMVNEGEQLVKEAKATLMEQTEASGQKKWRFNELTISKVEVRESLTYKKDKLLQLFTEEQLKPASEIKLAYSYVKITELRGEER